MADLVIQGMYGFGDNIYQRAFVRKFPGSYIITPFPGLYEDLGLKCVKPNTKLRTQAKNVEASEYPWHSLPRSYRTLKIAYGHNDLFRGSILSTMQRIFGSAPVFDLPDYGHTPVKTKKPIALIRPVTLRKEWLNSSRAPLPEYVCRAAEILKQKGFYVVSVADIEDGEEWIVGEEPFAHKKFHHGELSFTQLLALVQKSSVVVGGVGWIVPAAISAKKNAFIIQGGNGAHNAPDKVAPGDFGKRITWAIPDKFCMCAVKEHNCNKEISSYDEKITKWADAL